MTKSQYGENSQKVWHCFSPGLQRGDGLGRAPAHGNGSIENGRGHALEIARGSPRGLILVRDAPENERRSGKRKDFLPYGPRLSVVRGSHCSVLLNILSLPPANLFFPLMSKSPIIFSPFRYLVCSTTLWVGQVDKKATQQDLTNLFEEFGQIESINVSRPLPPLPSNFLAVCSFDLLTRNVMTVPQPVITVAVPNDLSCVFFKCLCYYPSFTRHTNLPVFSATLFCSL